MKKTIKIMAVLVLGGLLLGAAEKLEVDWIGNPAVGVGDQYSKNVGWLPDYEIGLRSDGVVVWRKIPPATNAPAGPKGN